MKIGIDIDDTICDTWEFLIPYLSAYFKINIEELRNSSLPYYEACHCTFDEYCVFAKKYYLKISQQYKLKDYVVEILNRLKKEGHHIIFITARSSAGFDDPYKASIDYLKNNKIPFDKLIVNAKDKARICVEEKIDLFIDDSINNCIAVSSKQIPVLLFNTSYNQNCLLFKRVFDWKEVYIEIEKVNNNGRQSDNF